MYILVGFSPMLDFGAEVLCVSLHAPAVVFFLCVVADFAFRCKEAVI